MSTTTETRDQILQRIRERNTELKRLDRLMTELRQANMRDEFALDEFDAEPWRDPYDKIQHGDECSCSLCWDGPA